MTQPLEDTSSPNQSLERLLLGGVLLATLARVWCTPADAMDHLMIPDGAEYIAAASRWVRGLGVNISVAGTVYPTRYVPGFSLLLAPVYFFFRDNAGAGIFVTTVFALIAAFAAFRLARKLTGSLLAGALAALALGFEPTSVAVSRSIQSDGPATSLVLLAMLFGLCAYRSNKRGALIATGCLLGVATAIRPLLIVLAPLACLLFLVGSQNRNPRRIAIFALALGLPTAIAFLATGLYQLKTFGSFSRTGYAFWVPLPYEFPDLIFAGRYFSFNWFYTGSSMFLASCSAAVGLLLLAWAKGRSAVMTAICLLVGPALISLFHLFYLWPSLRFHSVFFATAVMLLGTGLGASLTRLGLHAMWSAPAVLGAGLAFLFMPRPGMPPTPFPALIREVVETTPRNALVVTDAPASLFDILAGGRQQYVATRAEEYAGKLIAPKPLTFPQGRPAELTWPTTGHRPPLLRIGGAVDAVPTVALEDLAPVDTALAAGQPVFLDVAYTPNQLQAVFVARYDCIKVSPRLVQVQPKP